MLVQPRELALVAEAIVAAGRAAWPRVDLRAALMAEHLAGLPALPAPAYAADVYLACACARGHAAALAELEARIIRQVPAMVRGLGDAAFADEVQQEVRTRLLVARPDGPPRIAGYGGRGSLVGWVRAAAVRLAIDLRRARAAARGSWPAADPDLPADDDPELAYLRARHGEVLETALAASLAALPERVRRALRLHVDGGLSAVRIGALLGVHHATVSRWLASARTTVLGETRRRVSASLRLSPLELASLARSMGGRLDRGLAPVLAAQGED